MIRDIRWAYNLGFKRGWKVGHRRGRKAAEPSIQRYHNKGCENHGGYKGAYMTFCPECGIEL